LSGAALSEERVPTWVLSTIVVAVVTVGVVLTAATASIFGDGSAYLLSIVASGESVGLPGRVFISAVRDAPVVVAVGLGETNLHVLSVIHSVGYVLLPVAAWVAALLVSASDRLRFAIVAVQCGLCVGYLGFFSVSELFGALALVAFASTSLGSTQPWRVPQALAVAVAVTLLISAHEAVALCAVLLVTHGVARARARLGTADTWVSIWVSCAGVITILWAVNTWLTAPNGSANGFRSALVGLIPHSAVLLVAAALLLVAWLLVGGFRAPRGISLGVVGVVIASTGAAVAGVVLVSGLWAGYHARVWCLLLVLLGQVLLLATWWTRRAGSPSIAPAPSESSLIVLVIFTLVVLLMPLANAVTWSRGLAEFRQVLRSDSGPVSPVESLSPDAQRILWGWTDPSLSVVVRSSATDGVMINREIALGLASGYSPYDASTAQRLLPPEFTWR
jgi:hypothetical protein